MGYKHYLLILTCLTLFSCRVVIQGETSSTAPGEHQNNLAYAVAWKQTAAEYRALYYQGFNLARLRVQQALDTPGRSGRTLAVISDLDDTLLLAHDYWGYLINSGQDFFDDSAWDAWIAEQRVMPSPGALEFLRFCEENGVEVFYVTNRDQGAATFDLALASLQALDFPFADPEHLTVLRETSNKETIQQAIRAEYDVVALLGDNLNDFSRAFYVTDVGQRQQLTQQHQQQFGQDFIVFPNPTDGHWIRAIFGESEPAASADNRLHLHEAATHNAWQRP